MHSKNQKIVRVEESDPALEFLGFDAGGGEVYNYNGQPFTGVLIERNGLARTEVSFVAGYECGFVCEYSPTGMLVVEYYKKYNRHYGPYTEWDDDGSIISINDYGLEPQI
jgi:antitoxin component YwqK of YwqJK toxin-antitoxin module